MPQLITSLTTKPGTGVLASDEAQRVLTTRFAEIGLPPADFEMRRAYREMLYTTPGIGEHLSGLIFYEDMLEATTSTGVLLREIIDAANIAVGVTVDQGRVFLQGSQVERVTIGLKGLEERLDDLISQGVSFCKWRAEFRIAERYPSETLVLRNTSDLAEFAAICLSKGLTPMVEPDVMRDGTHSAEKCSEISTYILYETMRSLREFGVDLSNIVLKTHMITGGVHGPMAEPEEVGELTISVLSKSLPISVPVVAFLSGGQPESQTNDNLLSISREAERVKLPQLISFSFGRSLQTEAARTWKGDIERNPISQARFLESLRAATASVSRHRVPHASTSPNHAQEE